MGHNQFSKAVFLSSIVGALVVKVFLASSALSQTSFFAGKTVTILEYLGV